jgi:hypothetical protein
MKVSVMRMIGMIEIKTIKNVKKIKIKRRIL